MVVRLLPHSSSDDHSKYRLQEDIEEDKLNDPIEKFKNECTDVGIFKVEDFNKLEEKISNMIDNETLWTENQEDPVDSMENLFADEVEFDDTLHSSDTDIVLVDAINHA